MTEPRLPGAERHGSRLSFRFDGEVVEAWEGETIAAALYARGVRALRRSRSAAEPRGIYCNMGICYECLVRIDGREERSCMTVVRDGLNVESSQ